MTDYSIRGVEASDIPFIYSTWLNSYQCDSRIGKSVKRSIFFENYRLIVDQILEKNTTKIFIACKPDEPTVIYGYLIAEPEENILHYVFIKQAFWGFNIAKSLFNAAFVATPNSQLSAGVVTITHLTYSYKNNEKFIYNPFLLWKTGENHV